MAIPEGHPDHDLAEKLGQLIDTVDNYAQYSIVCGPFEALPPDMRFDALNRGLKQVRDTLYGIYISLGAEDAWRGAPLDEWYPAAEED